MPDEKQTPATEIIEPPSFGTPELRDRRPKPEGVVPKQSQAYVIAGLAVLILLAVMFSNNRAKPAAKPSAAAPAVFSSYANQRNIDDLKRDLTEEQRKSEQQSEAQKAVGAGASSLPGG